MPSVTWQNLMNVLTLKGYDTKDVKAVKDAKDNITRFMICYNLNKSYLLEWMNECLKESNDQKSASESALHRAKGNNFYIHGNEKKSLEFYNKSVIIAPYKSEEMALALANRSAVLARLQHFEEALNDIELALESGYPEDKKHKLLLRKAKLLIDIKRNKEAIDILNKLQKMHIDDSDSKIKEDISSTCLKAVSLEPEGNKIKSCNLPKLAEGESNHFKCASSKIELKNSTEKGRYVVANKLVNLGDVLFIEKPFALIVLPDQTSKHCHHCCKVFNAPIPCNECNEALYCSIKCQEDSWLFYHKWECGGLQLCYNIGIAHLGLRVALLSQTTQDSFKYQQVYDLLPHTENMIAADLYQYALTAALLIIYLENKTTFFSEPYNKTEVEVMGGRILRHIAQLICNGHAITKIDTSDEDLKKTDKTVGEFKQRVGTAIYPSVSMLNHSCNNNITNCFVNDILIVRASRNIKKGEEVYNCYGPHYTHMEVEERQKILKSQYFFTCKCDKCDKRVNPESLLKPFSALQCTNCQGPVFKGTCHCASCGKQQNVVELMNISLNACSLATQGREMSEKGDFKGAIKCFEKSLELGQKCLFRNNFDLLHYKDQLAKNYVELGYYSKSATYLKQCLPIVEERYGENSLELTREYLKLRDIRFLQLSKLSNDPTSPEYRHILKKTKKLLMKVQAMIEVNAGAFTPEQKKAFDDCKFDF